MNDNLITHDEAREIVQQSMFSANAVDGHSIEWDLLHQYNPTSGNDERKIKYWNLPVRLQQRIENALVLRDRLDTQLNEADKWLRQHFPEYAQPLIRKLQPQKTGTRDAVEPVMVDRALLDALLIEHFGALQTTVELQPKFHKLDRRFRYPGDDKLVEEGASAIKTGQITSAHAAARLLAPRCMGGASLNANIDRLRRAIGDRLKGE